MSYDARKGLPAMQFSWGTITVGQEVAVLNGYGEAKYVLGYVVTKITASGQVVVQKGEGDDLRIKRFDKDGYEMGTSSSRYHKDRLEPNLELARERLRYKEALGAARAAAYSVQKHANSGNWSYYTKDALREELNTLQGLLDRAKALAEEI